MNKLYVLFVFIDIVVVRGHSADGRELGFI